MSSCSERKAQKGLGRGSKRTSSPQFPSFPSFTLSRSTSQLSGQPKSRPLLFFSPLARKLIDLLSTNPRNNPKMTSTPSSDSPRRGSQHDALESQPSTSLDTSLGAGSTAMDTGGFGREKGRATSSRGELGGVGERRREVAFPSLR